MMEAALQTKGHHCPEERGHKFIGWFVTFIVAITSIVK